MKIESYEQGTPSWIDLSTKDGDGAKVFYSSLFDWDYQDNLMVTGQMYSLALINGSAVAAINHLLPEQWPFWSKPAWNLYLAVDDIDEVAIGVAKHGGTILSHPFHISEAGRGMDVADPTGAVIRFWEPGSHIGAESSDRHGSMSWSVLATNMPEVAGQFFADLLGLNIAQDLGPSLDGERRYIVMSSLGPAFEIVQLVRQHGEFAVQPYWTKFFRVNDVDTAIATATAMGGKLLTGPMSLPNLSQVAKLQDPQGAQFGVQSPPAG